MNYREVKASERLPDKEGWYWIYVDYPVDGFSIKEARQFRLGKFDGHFYDRVISWLEPFEIREEKIEKMFFKYADQENDYGNLFLSKSNFEKAIKQLLT